MRNVMKFMRFPGCNLYSKSMNRGIVRPTAIQFIDEEYEGAAFLASPCNS